MLERIGEFIAENWIIVLFVIVFATLVANFVLRRLLRLLLRRAEQTRNLWDDALVGSVKEPAAWAVWLFGLNFAAHFTAEVNGLEWTGNLAQFNKTATVVLIAWVLLRLIARIQTNLTSSAYLKKPMDITTSKAIHKLLNASVVITSLLVILQSYGVSVSGVLAFGGIGGLAIGFAAQDLLANFFGALMIYLDKPFAVGDWIRSPDREIEGVVEDIGWRQTLIRTFDKRPLYVPNSLFAKIAVENPSRMSHRRIYETIGLRYEDAGKVAEIVAAVRQMLQTHPAIDARQTLIANLNSFGPSSVDFFIYAFTKTTDWVEYHRIKQDVLLQIEGLVEAAGAAIAYPTRTVHLEPGLPGAAAAAVLGQGQGGTAADNGDAVALLLRDKTLDEAYALTAAKTALDEADLRAEYGAMDAGMQRMQLGNRIREAADSERD